MLKYSCYNFFKLSWAFILAGCYEDLSVSECSFSQMKRCWSDSEQLWRFSSYTILNLIIFFMRACWSLPVGRPSANDAAFSSQLWFILPIKATAKKQHRRTRSCELIKGSIVSSVGSSSGPDVPVVQTSRSIAGVTSHGYRGTPEFA